MKALSLRQPWAWMVLNGKHIENRRWNANYRGPFLLHAAKGMHRDEYSEAVDFARDVNPRLVVPAFESLARGGIVGRARLVEVIAPCVRSAKHKALGPLFAATCEHPWHMPEQFGFVLDDVQPMSFIPWSGALGFFNVPDKVLVAQQAKVNET